MAAARDVDQELALVNDDFAEVGTAPPQSLLSRASRPVAVALSVAATFGVGFAAGQAGGLSGASLHRAMVLEETAAEIQSYKTMQATSFAQYKGYTGSLEARTGTVVTIHNADTTEEDFVWALNLQGSTGCDGAAKGLAENACTIQITTSTSCDSPNTNFFYTPNPGTNPYQSLVYEVSTVAGIQVSANRKEDVATGYTGTQMANKTLLIFDSAGSPALCAQIERSPLSDLPGGACFPGDASASVQGRGAVPLANLAAGDPVLVQRSSGELAYEPLVGFLHATKGSSRFLAVEHMGGELRASANHLIFVADGTTKLASELQAGDALLALDAKSEKAAPSTVLSVRTVSGEAGMIAPLTMTGSIVVDGAVASAYATHSPSAPIPHGALHTLFFPARLLARASFGMFGAGPSPSGEGAETMHPLASLYAQVLIPFAKTMLSL